MPGTRFTAAMGTLLAFGCAAAWSQGGIYTCTDAKGRRLTSDRPIVECLDREQKELTPTGSVKRVIKPTLSAEEQAIEDEKVRKATEAAARAAEEKKRDRALAARYPNRAAHDREREQAVASVDDVIAAANKRSIELAEQRTKLQGQMEFYKNDRSKMPASMKRQLDEIDANMAAQKRFIANQEQEKQRVNAHFDEELVRLESAWAEQRRMASPASAAAAKAAAAPASAAPAKTAKQP